MKKKNKKMIAPSAKKAKIAPKRTLKTFSNPLPAEVTTGLASLYISPTFAVDSLANFIKIGRFSWCSKELTDIVDLNL